MSGRHMAFAEGRAKDTSGVLQRLWPYFSQYKGRLLIVALVLVVGTLTDLVGPYLIGVSVDRFIDPSGASSPAWLDGLIRPDMSRQDGLAVVMTILAAVYVVGWFLNVIQFRLMVRVAQRVLLTMRSDILRQIQKLSLDFFDQREAGDLMSRLINDTQVINDMFGPGLMRILRMGLTLVGIIVSMVALNWRLAAAAYAILPVIVAVTIFFSRRVRSAYRQTRKTIGDVSAELQENIAGVREVQAFARESATMTEFRTTNERNRAANVEAATLTSLFMPMLDVLGTIALAVVIGYGGYLVLAFDPPLVSIGIIVAFMAYVRRFYQPIREMANLYGQLQAALAGAERIFELLDVEPTITDSPDAIDRPGLAGRLGFEHVSFAYSEGELVLDDVSFQVEPGQTIALVGPTGAGKTTIVNLLDRFYDPDEGVIRVDGHDIRKVTVASLRQQIGIVPQDTFLFSGTVIDNIRYGRLDASDEEIFDAARLANAHGFIEGLPEGYQTVLGERGSGLSHGNRQLLAIARAILKAPTILILDEATSSVDTRTELLIQKGLNALMRERTNVVIAHRLSTIRDAHQILVIQGGRIVERGTHRSLLDAQGVYYGLYMSQFRRQEDLEAVAEAPGASAS